MQLTRSQFLGTLVLGSTRLTMNGAATRGVDVGVQSISFRDRSLDAALDAVVKAGIGTVELWAGHVEPVTTLRDRSKLRAWRLAADLGEFRKIRQMFDRRRIRLTSYDIGIRSDCPDAEIDRMFEMARALGVATISSSSDVKVAGRLEEFVRRHKVRVGFHNLSSTRAGDFATPDDFRNALSGRSEYLGVTLDTGHFTAAGSDPLAFLEQFHQRVFVVHLKDRKRNQGPAVPFGTGDTPVDRILLAIRDHGWKIPVQIECQYSTPDVVAEVGKLHDYVKRTLAS